ncbi:hypothetical protein [Radiobacillus sp. PE A8.2]|uniref:hypothetical protein n=1 Tax=Radiobacillus sp. PE A8.2 TaxID=3380349 RepID=UPI00389031A1
MGKRKKKKGNTPRHKRMDRPRRLQAALHWIPKYDGKNLVRGYSRHFNVNQWCAVNELETLGYHYSESYMQQIKNMVTQTQQAAAKRKAERKRKQESEMDLFEDSDETFAFIAGYTDGGAPFGISWEEWAEQEKDTEDEPERDRRTRPDVIDDDLLF